MNTGLPVYRAAGETWTASMVLRAAEFLGLTHPLRASLAAGLAAAAYADEEGFEPDEETLQEASETFRYERGLLTAEETEEYLERWGASLEDLTDYLARRYWKTRFASDLPGIERDYAPASESVDGALWAEAVFDGAASEWIVACARRSAAFAESGGAESSPDGHAADTLDADMADDIEATRRGFFEQTGVYPDSLEEWLLRRGFDVAFFERLCALEAAYRRFRNAALAGVDTERALSFKRMRLVRVHLERAVFPTEEAAREALLCVSQDRERLADVARCAGVILGQDSRFLDELASPLDRLCVSALAGETLGPLEEDGSYVLYGVTEKIEPDPRDERVKSRLEREALDVALERLTNAHVAFIVHPGEVP